MAKHRKTLEKLKANSNIKWNELKSLLEGLGYKMLKNDGSRRKFYHEEKQDLIICHQPHPSPDVDKGCIADVAEHLKNHGFFEVN